MMWSYLLLLCFPITLGCRSTGEIEEIEKKRTKYPKYFTSGGWGSWIPSEYSWKKWIEIWGNNNSSVAFDSTEVGRDPESGWPRYWKGLGKGNSGVPPPPWAYVPESYGKPKLCYMQPAIGTCSEALTRWGFNPTRNNCQRFFYSGCGGNENNFMNKHDCVETCGRIPDTECVWEKIDFRDYLQENKSP